jgi:actin-related protein 5
MAPSATDLSAQTSEPQNALPPPKLYTPREIHFEKYLDAQTDGYRQAKSRGPGRAAIVIDNGNKLFATNTGEQKLTRTKQAHQQLVRAGPSRMRHA